MSLDHVSVAVPVGNVLDQSSSNDTDKTAQFGSCGEGGVFYMAVCTVSMERDPDGEIVLGALQFRPTTSCTSVNWHQRHLPSHQLILTFLRLMC